VIKEKIVGLTFEGLVIQEKIVGLTFEGLVIQEKIDYNVKFV
jgi:hypothetical protein